MIEVLAKGLGKNVEEASVKHWYFEEGDRVTEGDDLVEIVAGNSTVVISVPASGILAEVCFDENETVQRDEVLCVIDEKKEDLEEESEDEEEEPEAEEESGEDEEDY